MIKFKINKTLTKKLRVKLEIKKIRTEQEKNIVNDLFFICWRK